jgi:hypothetical protein
MKFYIVAKVQNGCMIESHRSTEQTAGAVVKRLEAVGVPAFVVSEADLSVALDLLNAKRAKESTPPPSTKVKA